MSDTTIEWTNKTWSPTTGCTKVSPGCANCYIVRTPPFRMNHRKFERVDNEMTTGVTLHPERLEQPLKWRKPQKIFVNSMSDLFHEDVPDIFIAKVFAIMFLAPQHTFQVLTKRPDRMYVLLSSDAFWWHVAHSRDGGMRFGFDEQNHMIDNVHLGVSVENQYWADQRIPLLLKTPAAVRFVSYEPALKAVDFSKWLHCWCPCHVVRPTAQDEATGMKGWDVPCSECGKQYDAENPWMALDQIIMGGESGPKSRPMHPDWVRATRDQCVAADVQFFFKQWGGKNKKVAGAMLDGREWRQFPKEAEA